MSTRWDETWHRLRVWTNGQAPSERLAAQILLQDGYTDLDPSHPLGGKDGAKDALAAKDGLKWTMAVYFPKGQKGFRTIKQKFLDDLRGVAASNADAMAFVTNQELTLAQREALTKAAAPTTVALYHLERMTTLLDTPAMIAVRQQFLGITPENETVASIKTDVAKVEERLVGFQTGGDTFCYCMLYHFDLIRNIAKNFCVIRRGEYPLYDLRIRIYDLEAKRDVLVKNWGEMNSPADGLFVEWALPASVYYRIFFHTRNGNWHQDLILRRSVAAGCWVAATRVMNRRGDAVVFSEANQEFFAEFGEPLWRS